MSNLLPRVRSAAALSALPVTAVLPLVSCDSSGIEGDWDLDLAVYDGESVRFPYTSSYSYSYDGYTYAYEFTVEMTLEIEDETGGDFVMSTRYSYTYTDPSGQTRSYSDSGVEVYDADLSEGKEGGRYRIEVQELELDLDCVLDGDELDCEDDQSGFSRMLFVRG